MPDEHVSGIRISFQHGPFCWMFTTCNAINSLVKQAPCPSCKGVERRHNVGSEEGGFVVGRPVGAEGEGWPTCLAHFMASDS